MDLTFEAIMAEMSAAPSSEPSSQAPPPAKLDFNDAPPQADDPDPVFKIEQMTECLHGKHCRYLKFNGRNICSAADTAIFDLCECPLQKWAPRQRKFDEN